jgi:hypothetical protein
MLQLVVDDTVIELLESDNLVLQTMSTSKYVQVLQQTLAVPFFLTADTREASIQ